MKKLLDKLFSTSASGLYTILFATAIGIATFIENDFGTSAAQKVVYRARWFEVLLLLFAISIVVNVFRYRMVQNKKWAILTFHLSVLVILLGAAITRFFGYEGIMHIREGDTSNLFVSNESYLSFDFRHNNEVYHVDEEVYFASLGRNSFNKSYQVGDKEVEIQLLHFTPNPVEKVVPDDLGIPILTFVISTSNGRQDVNLRLGDDITIGGIVYNFSNQEAPGAVNFYWENGELTFDSFLPLSQMTMATQETTELPENTRYPLMVRSLYSGEGVNFVISDFKPKGKLMIQSAGRKITSESTLGVHLRVGVDGQSTTMAVYGNIGYPGRPNAVFIDGVEIAAAYGSIEKSLPFAIKLNDFIMDRYPGTNSASSYASEVTLIDRRKGINRDQRIYMNNILNHDGYRFFQSSYDKDEQGTVLSVNHDFWGTWVSYFGYFLLTVGMMIIFFSPKSRFTFLSRRLSKMRESALSKAALVLPFIMALSMSSSLQAEAVITGPWRFIDPVHTENMSRVLVQDFQGRFKPFHTLANEVMRKVAKKESLYDLTAQQVILGMLTFPNEWAELPLIKLGKNDEIIKLVNVDGDRASYNDFFNPRYILSDLVQEAYDKEAKERGAFEKEVIKLDERVNIVHLILNQRMTRFFPNQGDQNNTWLTPAEASFAQAGKDETEFINSFFPTYVQEVKASVNSNNWDKPNQLVEDLIAFQKSQSGEIIPSNSKVKMEILLNKLNVFTRLGMYYGMLGMLILIMFFISVFKHNLNLKWPLKIAVGLLIALFVFHTFGLGLRWYVSGRAPWSNGYESMIYIGWTTILAGLIFTRRSLGGMAATTILASTILMVAWLSYLDPEITPLVPVLRSYWLTIHVSLVAGSYGFLMLGAILGVLNLVLMIFTKSGNKEKVYRTIRELTVISEMTLLGGLFMMAVGTYLGGVWANESWGRYWGWDAKETWALVTILVYTFILHMRFIPGMKSMYAFNLASLFGWASVVMTYFGVNYYLSGLHSYAAGDPVPIPSFVYYAVISLTIISVLAYFKNKKFGVGQIV